MQLNQLTQHIYWSTPEEATDRPVLGAIVGEKDTLMVDGGNSPAHALEFLNLLSSSNIPHPKYLFITHWHWDHVFGAETVNALTIASEETTEKIREMSRLDWRDKALDKRVEEGLEIAFCRDCMKVELTSKQRSSLRIKIPEISFNSQILMDLGNINCQIQHVGGDHSSDSSILFVPEEKIVFLGDCIYDAVYKDPREYTIQNLYPLLDQLLAYEADYYLDSHGSKPMPREELAEFSDYMKTIGNVVSKKAPNKEDISKILVQLLDRPLNEDDRDYIDTFIAGLR